MTTDAIKQGLAARAALRERFMGDPHRTALTVAALCMASEDANDNPACVVANYANDLPGGKEIDEDDCAPVLALLTDARLCSCPSDDRFYLDYKARGEIALWGAGGWLGRMLAVELAAD